MKPIHVTNVRMVGPVKTVDPCVKGVYWADHATNLQVRQRDRRAFARQGLEPYGNTSVVQQGFE